MIAYVLLKVNIKLLNEMLMLVRLIVYVKWFFKVPFNSVKFYSPVILRKAI